MTITANIHEAKTTLSKLIERALAGEDIVIAKAGKPVVRLTPVNQGPAIDRASIFGKFAGQMILSDDWEDSPFDAEMERRWYGDETQERANAAEKPRGFKTR